jgi:hypothetical protein
MSDLKSGLYGSTCSSQTENLQHLIRFTRKMDNTRGLGGGRASCRMKAFKETTKTIQLIGQKELKMICATKKKKITIVNKLVVG